VGAHDEEGQVRVVVSADGSAVASFVAEDVPIDALGRCPGTVDVNLSNIPISRFIPWFYTLVQVGGVNIEVDGDFKIPGFVTGFIDVEQPGTDCFNIVQYAATLITPSATQPPPGAGWGDVDCNGVINAVDALKLLRFVVGLPVAQEPGCPALSH